MRTMRVCAILVFLSAVAPAGDPGGWTLTRSPHFTVYSNSTPETSHALAASLERLHAFFSSQLGMAPPPARELRVIAFATRQEYAQYRNSANSDAFYIGAPDRDYIVLPVPHHADEIRIPAHEYAHVLIHSAGLRLPEWLAEGIGDVVSTIHFRERETSIGGDLPGRSAVFKTASWFPLADLFDLQADRAPASIFYAESWAVADLLMLSPAYSRGFPSLLTKLASGVPAPAAIAAVYATTPAAIERDARSRHPIATTLPAIDASPAEIHSEPVAPFTADLVLADLRLANREFALAESLYRGLLPAHPASPEIHAALGTLALERGDTAAAAQLWARAIDLGIADSALCFRYANLADTRGLPIRPALERAIALRPDFDDARFKLALLESNASHPDAAVAQLRAMREIGPPRAFSWWATLANALLDLNRRDEARDAAAQAQAHAVTPEERARASQIEWMATTELAVELDGKTYRTVRVPINAPPRNPFVEPNDRPARAEATLREIQCPDDRPLALLLDTPTGQLTLTVPDPTRVEIRNSATVTFDFTCGPQPARPVQIEYAPSSLILRGLTLR